MTSKSILIKPKKPGQARPSLSNQGEKRLFEALDTRNKGFVYKSQLLGSLESAGITKDLVLTRPLFEKLAEIDERKKITLDGFIELTRDCFSFLQKLLTGRLVIPDFKRFKKNINLLFQSVKTIETGEVADYIPQLARVDNRLLSLSICTIDGQMFSLGDTSSAFSAQSTCKVLNYCLVQKEHGEERVHQFIGQEPSGHRFNVLRLNKEMKPHNPFINAGAIMACSLIQPGINPADRFDYVMKTWEEACGGLRPGFNNAVYLSEKNSADRNYAIAYFMQEKKAFPPSTNIHEVLEFYFQCCSIELTTTHLSILGATLANAGVCPLTQKQIFAPETVKNCLSLMYSCGLYDFSGQFAFKVGLPAKSGVSGAIVLVVPNVMGTSIYSPKVDTYGNSVRGIAFCTELVKKFNFHNFDSLVNQINKEDPRYHKNTFDLTGSLSLIWAASQGDLPEIQRQVNAGVDLNQPDYDGRTALHLAAAKGQLSVVKYLLSKKVQINPQDRFGNTPLDEALSGRHHQIAEILISHDDGLREPQQVNSDET